MMKIAVHMMWNPRAATSPQGITVQNRKRYSLPPVGTSDIALLQGTATPAHLEKSTAGVIPSSQTRNGGSNRFLPRLPPKAAEARALIRLLCLRESLSGILEGMCWASCLL